MGTFKKLEDIEVWKRSCRLAVDIFKLTDSKELSQKWSLKDQILRSAMSVPSNIAEGFERDSTAEFKRFLQIAKGSCGELRTQLYILKSLELLPSQTLDQLISKCLGISSMIQSLVTHLKSFGKS
jgi:four helix bundle protein